MAVNEVKKIFYGSTNWTAPAGVSYITVNPIYSINSIKCNGSISSSYIKSFNNKLYSFGNNTNGQLGVGDVVHRSSPVAVLGASTGLLLCGKLESNGISTIVLSTTNIPNSFSLSGFLYSFGDNLSGQLGVGDIIPRSSPVAVAGGMKFYDFSLGVSKNSVLALSQKGKLYSWGDNTYGQLGVGDIISRSSPVAVLGSYDVAQFGVSEGDLRICSHLITTSNQLYTWGQNDLGQLGIGNTTNTSSPVVVAGTWSKVLNTGSSFFGIALNGVPYSWGYNFHGQLGVGNTTNRSAPTIISNTLKFSNFYYCGLYSTYGITSEGKLYSWGNNYAGQLGLGDVIKRSSPVAVLGNLKFSKIIASKGNAASSIYGITTSGDLYAWGENAFGQLGVGDVVPRSSPTLVLGGLKWVDLDVGGISVITVTGLASDGQVYSWGANTYGQGGLGDVANRSSPVVTIGTMSAASLGYSQFAINSQERKFKVVPGTSYDILFSQGISFFNNTPIATGKLDRIEISYFM